MNTEHEIVGDVLADMGARFSGDANIMYWRSRIERAHARESAAQVRVPEGWREFVEKCAGHTGLMVNGNRLSAEARSLLSAAPSPAAEPDPKPAPSDARADAHRRLCEYGQELIASDMRAEAPSDAQNASAGVIRQSPHVHLRPQMIGAGIQPAPSDAPASPQAAHSPATNGATEPCDALDGAAPCACGAWHSGPQAAQGDTVTIDAHWLETIASAATLLELSKSPEDQREGAALRKLLASAKPVAAQGDVEALLDSVENIQAFARAYKAEVPNAELTVHGIAYGLGAVARRLASAQPATAKPAGDAEFKVGDRVLWTDGLGDVHRATVAMAVPQRYHLETDGGLHTTLPVPASSLTRLTGGSHD